MGATRELFRSMGADLTDTASVEERDQQVIDAMMDEDPSRRRELAPSGLSFAAVAARGRELGLTDGFIKACRLSGSRPAMRACIACDARFLSTGVHNRLCRRCRR